MLSAGRPVDCLRQLLIECGGPEAEAVRGYFGLQVSFFSSKSVLGIRIRRIRMDLGLPDPDPLVRGVAPDPDTFLIKS